MKNVVKWWKDFLLYFTTPETYRVQGMDHGHETSSFQVMSAADAVQHQQGPPQAVMVKTEENYPMQIDQSSVQVSDGNIQVLSSDGSMV